MRTYIQVHERYHYTATPVASYDPRNYVEVYETMNTWAAEAASRIKASNITVKKESIMVGNGDTYFHFTLKTYR